MDQIGDPICGISVDQINISGEVTSISIIDPILKTCTELLSSPKLLHPFTIPPFTSSAVTYTLSNARGDTSSLQWWSLDVRVREDVEKLARAMEEMEKITVGHEMASRVKKFFGGSRHRGNVSALRIEMEACLGRLEEVMRGKEMRKSREEEGKRREVLRGGRISVLLEEECEEEGGGRRRKLSIGEDTGKRRRTNEDIRDAVKEWGENMEVAEGKYGHISDWDVGKVTDMSKLFMGMVGFDEDISRWEVGRVTKMHDMFFKAEKFDGDLGSWDVGSVSNMACMFAGASSFTGKGLSGWETGNVRSMFSMFYGAEKFDGDLKEWNTSGCTNMYCMFQGCKEFEGDVGGWVTMQVGNMTGMFCGAIKFRSDLRGWSTGRCKSMNDMFKGADKFDLSCTDEWVLGKGCRKNW